MSTGAEHPVQQQKARLGASRWPMALAVLATGVLRATLPHELRNSDRPLPFLVLLPVLLPAGLLVIARAVNIVK